MADLCCVMPAMHPYAPGAVGNGHGKDYFIADPMKACVGSAKWQLCMLHVLLKDGAKKAKEIVQNFKPMFESKEAFFEYVDGIARDGDRIT